MAGPTAVAQAPQAPPSTTDPAAQAALQALEGTLEVRRESNSSRGTTVAVHSTTVQKRKREGSDQQGPAGGSPRRGGAKRVATNSAAVPSNDAPAQDTDNKDATAMALAQPASAQAGTGDDDGSSTKPGDSGGNLELGSLSQGQNNDQSNRPGPSAEQIAANSAAIAALAGIFPSMTVPRPTDVSFAASTSGADESNLDSSFGMGEREGESNQGSGGSVDADGGQLVRSQQSGGDGGSARKFAVGSEEWHRVRRDNHKEGTSKNMPSLFNRIMRTQSS